jgi:hypothetical protein
MRRTDRCAIGVTFAMIVLEATAASGDEVTIGPQWN